MNEVEKIRGEVENIITGLKMNCNPNPLGSMKECLAAAQIEALEAVLEIIKIYQHGKNCSN